VPFKIINGSPFPSETTLFVLEDVFCRKMSPIFHFSTHHHFQILLLGGDYDAVVGHVDAEDPLHRLMPPKLRSQRLRVLVEMVRPPFEFVSKGFSAAYSRCVGVAAKGFENRERAHAKPSHAGDDRAQLRHGERRRHAGWCAGGGGC
jgi:hypothetical protein